MGKRSNFARLKHDAYQTVDPRAVRPLLPFLRGVRRFAEPCVGEGFLVRHLEAAGLACVYSGDLATGQDARHLKAADCAGADAIITNPPWTRSLLHELIRVFMSILPTWLLFDADWKENVDAAPLLRHCTHIVPIGRTYWFENSPSTGKDNVDWYRFKASHTRGPHFFPRQRFPAMKGARRGA